MYLAPSDYNVSTRPEAMNMVTRSTAAGELQRGAEIWARGIIEGYLNFRYNVQEIFKYNTYDYSNAKAYIIGDVVRNEQVGYTCIQNAPANTPISDTAFFQEGDPRNAVIVQAMVDLVAYRLYLRTPGSVMPEHITKQYDEAMKVLEKIRKQQLNLSLPTIPLEERAETTETWHVKSNPKNSNNW